MSQCSTCKRPILWALTENGGRIPLDPEPRADGNIVLRKLAGVDDVVARVLGPHDHVAETRYVSHFATCPQAETHRRRQRRRERRAA